MRLPISQDSNDSFFGWMLEAEDILISLVTLIAIVLIVAMFFF